MLHNLCWLNVSIEKIFHLSCYYLKSESLRTNIQDERKELAYILNYLLLKLMIFRFGTKMNSTTVLAVTNSRQLRDPRHLNIIYQLGVLPPVPSKSIVILIRHRIVFIALNVTEDIQAKPSKPKSDYEMFSTKNIRFLGSQPIFCNTNFAWLIFIEKI